MGQTLNSSIYLVCNPRAVSGHVIIWVIFIIVIIVILLLQSEFIQMNELSVYYNGNILIVSFGHPEANSLLRFTNKNVSQVLHLERTLCIAEEKSMSFHFGIDEIMKGNDIGKINCKNLTNS